MVAQDRGEKIAEHLLLNACSFRGACINVEQIKIGAQHEVLSRVSVFHTWPQRVAAKRPLLARYETLELQPAKACPEMPLICACP